MPVLANAKHEFFAQALAKGKNQDEAYEFAGYKPSRHHASRLATKGNVTARVAELLERSAARTEISIASITESLLRLAVKGENMEEPAGLSVARASLMDAAKLNGLIVEKSDVNMKAAFTRIENVIVDAANPNGAGVSAAADPEPL